MTKYLSQKLTFFSFWLIVVVVLLHSVSMDTNSSELTFFKYLEYLLSLQLAQIAVPCFFMISGYLFFIKLKKDEVWTLNDYGLKLKKRVNTLLVPYILWCFIWFGIIYLLQTLPVTKTFFNQPLYSLSTKEFIYNLIVYPLNYPFWFLRELMLYVIITPIIYILIRKFNLLIFFLLIGFSVINESLFTLGGIKVFHVYPLLFYTIVCYLSIRQINIEKRLKVQIVLIALVLWLILNNIIIYFDYYQPHKFLPAQLTFITNLLGCMAMWFGYDFLSKYLNNHYNFYKYSFFIFAFHGIPIVFLKKIIEKLDVDSALYNFILYLFTFIFISILSIIVGVLVEKVVPRTYNVLTGKR
ncbi:acyltransferase family protein [Aequorivita xiaoshiensis]|uniref:Acyltransferase n=1 Tax=Aequorivita xiaoshiensis TaxID=2874476 RepID=A0A9X1R3L5_9FLAO|nr:acyltransferase [Aequorivita xiaoshiensis]MCG2431659.1 acyltransferase [Aequorivita xiaoshiensis]